MNSLQDPTESSSLIHRKSIWQDFSEDVFRRHLVTLEERTNAVPVKPQTFPATEWVNAHAASINPRFSSLSIDEEQLLANNFAFIAAVGEGAQSVSAACIEESFDAAGLTIRLAAVDTIREDVQATLKQVANVLGSSAKGSNDSVGLAYSNEVLELIVKQQYAKLLGRLRSAKWDKPVYLSRTHKKALWQDFENLIHRVQFIYPKKKDTIRTKAEEELRSLEIALHGFEQAPDVFDVNVVELITLAKLSHRVCTSQSVRQYAAALEGLTKKTSQVAAAIKCLRQVEKIAAYWRISCDLVTSARRYPSLFANLDFAYLEPYPAEQTEIGYESWAKTLHVHAEVALIIFYDQMRQKMDPLVVTPHHPRCIGTSKYLCYLCYLFIVHHGLFFPSSTHGRLYDQWTVPDLAIYGQELTTQYANILRAVDNDIVEMFEHLGPRNGKRDVWRVEPMTSRENLLLGVEHDTETRSLTQI